MLVWPGETVTIAASFAHPFLAEQRYLLHCHILAQQDAVMMRNLRVRQLLVRGQAPHCRP